MIVITGKSVSRGIVIGRLKFKDSHSGSFKRTRIEDTEKEWQRFLTAREKSSKQLEELGIKAANDVGEANAAIFEVHRMMLDDEDFSDSVKEIINSQNVNAEYAVAVTGDNFSSMFSAMDDEYMRARALDVRDISDRLIMNLTSTTEEFDTDGKCILCADDLTPSETILLDKNSVCAFIMRRGSSKSHTAILARTMGIPAIIGMGDLLSGEYDGKTAIVDSTTGEVIIDPDEQTLERCQRKISEYEASKRLAEVLKGKETITLDGRKINLYANVGSISDIAFALENDASGIGLFRSEFLYLSEEGYPSEDKQFAVYKTAAENMAGKPVIIRTLDIGADKKAGYLNLPDEENPALGWRAIRICLDRKEIFKTQLRALCRAGAYGNIMIMLPMITSVWEIRSTKAILEEVKKELRDNRLAYDRNMKLGIMIETPAAALISDSLAKEVDFFSIGTNDLTQYTLAADRQNDRLERYCDPHHPAILELIRMTVENAHKHRIWCGICGELGADLSLTEEFIRMGVDELSMSPSSILPVRKYIRELNLE